MLTSVGEAASSWGVWHPVPFLIDPEESLSVPQGRRATRGTLFQFLVFNILGAIVVAVCTVKWIYLKY